jgi:hypothetical protein
VLRLLATLAFIFCLTAKYTDAVHQVAVAAINISELA